MKVVIACFRTEEIDVFNKDRLSTFCFRIGEKYDGTIGGDYVEIKIAAGVTLTVTKDFFINHFYIVDSLPSVKIELNNDYVLKTDTALFSKGDIVTSFAKSYKEDMFYFVSKENYKKEYGDDIYKYQGTRVECISNLYIEEIKA